MNTHWNRTSLRNYGAITSYRSRYLLIRSKLTITLAPGVCIHRRCQVNHGAYTGAWRYCQFMPSLAVQVGTGKYMQSSPVWWENGSHHYKATQLSGHVTGLGLSRLCITPSTRLKNLRSTASDGHDSDGPHQSSSHLFPSSLFCFLVSSQSTISLRLLPPYAPRNETSIFVASYGSCSAIS